MDEYLLGILSFMCGLVCGAHIEQYLSFKRAIKKLKDESDDR
jgi:hypothetical protein